MFSQITTKVKLLCGLLLVATLPVWGWSAGDEGRNDWSEKDIEHYTCLRTTTPIVIDGDPSEAAWQHAPRSPRFVELAEGRPGFFDTRAAALWDDQNLYVAFWVQEPFVAATLTERDSTIFQENDVEVFIDGGDSYYEFEMNALNTLYEVFYIWKDAYKRKFDIPEFDVFSPDAYVFGGNSDRAAKTFWRGSHPRGARWTFPKWDFPGLRSATRVQGTLNDDSDLDQGWTAEIAFPWAGMKHLANGRSLPPRDGDEWRIFFARFEKLPVGNSFAHPAWSWGRMGVYDSHVPKRYPRLTFSKKTVN